jgi:NTE family protein
MSQGTSLAQHLRKRRVGVVLSAGFFGFFGHAGFWKALCAAGISPEAWAGTSAGGMVAAFAAAGAEVAAVEALLAGLQKRDFWDPDLLGILRGALTSGHQPTGLLRGERFRALLARHLPAARFEDCRTPLLLVAADLGHGEPALLCSGPLADAVHATCAYPGLFQAVPRDGTLLWDGGMVDKAPLLALAESPLGRGVDTFVVHYLPTRRPAPALGPLAYARGVSTGVSALRHAHFLAQVQALRARGTEVVVLESHLPAVSPSSLASGGAALDAAFEQATAALQQPVEGGPRASSPALSA